MLINIDLDKTLVDFDAGATKLLGKPFDKFKSSQAAWEALGDLRFDFFKNLQPMPDATELVEGVLFFAKKNNFEVVVLTALPKSNCVPLAKEHKREWVLKYFPELVKVLIAESAIEKQNFCSAGDILIDDNHLNISQWNAKGGFGILHKTAKETLVELNSLIKRY